VTHRTITMLFAAPAQAETPSAVQDVWRGPIHDPTSSGSDPAGRTEIVDTRPAPFLANDARDDAVVLRSCHTDSWTRFVFVYWRDVQPLRVRIEHELEATDVAAIRHANARLLLEFVVANGNVTGWATPWHTLDRINKCTRAVPADDPKHARPIVSALLVGRVTDEACASPAGTQGTGQAERTLRVRRRFPVGMASPTGFEPYRPSHSSARSRPNAVSMPGGLMAA
jgi:hypothetical protein